MKNPMVPALIKHNSSMSEMIGSQRASALYHLNFCKQQSEIDEVDTRVPEMSLTNLPVVQALH